MIGNRELPTRVLALALFGVLVLSCSPSRSAPMGTATRPTPTGKATLGALVNLNGPIEITYRWSGPNPEGDGPGTEIWKVQWVAGALGRSDEGHGAAK